MSLAPAAAGASIRTATSLGESSSCRSCSSNKNERSSSGRGFPGTNGSSELEHRRLHQMCHLRRLIPDPGQQQPGGPALLLPHALNFAQFGDGAGRFSQVLLVNPDPEKPARAKLTLTDNDGLPLVVDLNGEDVLEGQSSTILPQSLHSFSTDGLGDVRAGAVRVASNEPLTGVLLFGGGFGLAGVGSSQELANGFGAPAETEAGVTSTGVAIMNLEATALDLEFELYDSDGTLLASASDELPPRGHLALFVEQLGWDNPPDFSRFHWGVNGTAK